MRALALVILTAGCYSGSSAAGDVNAAWRGRSRVELEGRLGAPTVTAAQPDGSIALRWIAHGINIKSLPSGYLDLNVGPNGFSVDAEGHAGEIEKYDYILANALVAPGGTITMMDSISLAAGIPSGVNIRTGLVLGASGALGVFHDASSPRPSMNAYIGGMIGPQLALVGTYSFVNASDATDGWAMGHAWGFGIQYWPIARLALRAAPAAVLGSGPGLDDWSFGVGGNAAVSYAVVRAGAFVLDARIDATFSTNLGAFGMAGVGVNIN